MQHPTTKLNHLIADWIEPDINSPAQVISAQKTSVPGRVQ